MSRKTGTSPSKARRERTKHLVIKYYLEGRTMAEVRVKMMAEEKTVVSLGTISKMVKQQITEWKAEQNDFITDHKEIEIQKINNLEVTYFEAWQRSAEVAETFVNKLDPGKTARSKAKVKETIQTIRQSAGDPRFLLGIQWCIDKRCEILGTNAPQVIEANMTGNITTNTTIRQVLFTTKKAKYVAEAETITKNDNETD